MHVSDCVKSIIYVHEKLGKTDIMNLGNFGTTSVRKIADYVTEGLGLKGVSYAFTGGEGGRGAGSYFRTIDAADMLKQKEARLQINTLVTADNIYDLPFILKWLIENRTDFYWQKTTRIY